MRGCLGVRVCGCVGVWAVSAVSAIYAGDVLDGIAGMWSVSIFFGFDESQCFRALTGLVFVVEWLAHPRSCRK